MIDFRDDRLSEPLRLGGTDYIDQAPSLASAEARTLTADATGYRRTACYEGTSGNTIGQTTTRLVGAYAPRAYKCYVRVATPTLPDASDAAVVTGASRSVSRLMVRHSSATSAAAAPATSSAIPAPCYVLRPSPATALPQP